jgi:hypothetical protein
MGNSLRSVSKTVAANPMVSFDRAFAAARSAGADFFTWRDARYHTLTREELDALNTEPALISEQPVSEGGRLATSDMVPTFDPEGEMQRFL